MLEGIFWGVVYTVFGPIIVLWNAPHRCEAWRPPLNCPGIRLTTLVALAEVGVFFWVLFRALEAWEGISFLSHPKRGDPAAAGKAFAWSLVSVAVYLGLPFLFPGST